jgi:hypothetical protein
MFDVASSSRIPSPEPAIGPLTIRFLAIGHFTFAILILAFAFLNSAFESGSVDQGLITTLTAVDTPQSNALKRVVQRNSEVKDGLKKYLAGRLPSSTWVGPLSQTVDIGLAMLLFAAGSCLLQRRVLGRPLSIAFACICLGQKFLLIVYETSFEIPLIKKYFEPLMRMYPADANLFHGILDPMTNEPIYQLVLAVYPVVVLAVMLQAGAKTALTTSLAKPEQLPEIPLPQPAMAQMPVLQAVSDDPLDALMQRKTF